MVDAQFTSALSTLLHYSRDLEKVEDHLYNTSLPREEQSEFYYIIHRVKWALEMFKPRALEVLEGDKVPMVNMPWNIPGGVQSPEAIPASEYVDREMIHQMTVREDLLSTD